MKQRRHIELNVHSCGAFGETVITPEEIVSFAVQNGSKAVAVTDLSSVDSVYALAKAVNKSSAEIKAVYGVRLNCMSNDGSEFIITLLAKTRYGLKNIYRIMSSGYDRVLDVMKWPCVDWRFVLQNRGDILIGRECSWEYINRSRGKDETILTQELNILFEGVDYVEITPLNKSLFDSDIMDAEDLISLHSTAYKIVNIFQKNGKFPVAVSNASCITAEDELCWNILHQYGNKKEKAQAVFMKPTEDVLREFSFLGDLAEIAVIENTNLIADMIDSFDPMPVEFCKLNIPNAETEVRTRCRKAAEEKYGAEIPHVISARLTDELDKIANSDGWSYYLMAAKLADKCNELGYLHNIRGNAGGSFVAYLLGISEVNPLPPHYYCPKCGKVEFVDEKRYASGYDLVSGITEMPVCPGCGTAYEGDGHNTFCEFFLGYNGDRVPDFDFNIAWDIHKDMIECLEEIFGKDNIFYAGISGTFGCTWSAFMLEDYCSGQDISIDKSQKEQIVKRLSAVHKTNHRHPGGVVIVPEDHDIYDFTPAGYEFFGQVYENQNKETQIDYYSLPLEKIDILALPILSELKLMEEYTGVPANTVEFNDIDINGFFDSFDNDNFNMFINKNDFVKKFAKSIIPTKLSDFIKIYGFVYGSGVWTGNAEELVEEGFSIEDLIAFKDDVMFLLINHGVSRSEAFYIAEYVRMGRAYHHGFKEDQLRIMRDNNVPEYLIESMQKIKYLLPKAHAVEYVNNYLRKAWYKIYHPIEFYLAVLSVDVADFFDYSILVEGKNRVKSELDRFNQEWGPNYEFDYSNGEGWAEAQKKVLEIAMECYKKNIKFLPADINISDPYRFLPEDGTIRLPFNCPVKIDKPSVEIILQERAKKPFESLEDFRNRTKLSDWFFQELEKNKPFELLEL